MNSIPDWFWMFFMLQIIVLAGVGYQLHRIENKIGEIWRYLRGPD